MIVWLSLIVPPVNVPKLVESLTTPVRVAILSTCVSLTLMRLVRVTDRFSSSFIAVSAISFNVLRAPGAPSITSAISF